MIDSPFLQKDPAHWPLVAIVGVSAVGMAVLGIGFGFASYVLSGGQITEIQRPDRRAIIPWPVITPPALLTIAAGVIASIAILILTIRITVRTIGFLTTTYGWALAGALGAGSLAVAFPAARVGDAPLLPGLSDHAVGAGLFALAALAALLGQGSIGRATKAARAAGLNPGFLPIVPPQGTSPLLELDIQAPPMWRWTAEDGAPSIVPEEHRPAPMRIVMPVGPARPVTDPVPDHAVVNDAPARRERLPDGAGGTIMRYRYAPFAVEGERVIDMRIGPTTNRHELQAYIDCADLIAGSVRWHAPAPAPARRRRWWARS